MTWWSNADFAGDLNEVLSHVNEATHAPNSSATRICELYFHALNKWWNAFARYQSVPGRADTPSFIGLLRSMCESSRSTLLQCKPVNDLRGRGDGSYRASGICIRSSQPTNHSNRVLSRPRAQDIAGGRINVRGPSPDGATLSNHNYARPLTVVETATAQFGRNSSSGISLFMKLCRRWLGARKGLFEIQCTGIRPHEIFITLMPMKS
jgi:hypothetical protein